MNVLKKMLSMLSYRSNSDPLTISVENNQTIVFSGRNGVVVHMLPIDNIRAVGYMTSEPSVCGYDYFLLINANEITYCIPVEWPNVSEVICFLESSLPAYNTKIGLANSVVCDTLTVWPGDISGERFTFMSNVYPKEMEDCVRVYIK